jgi:DNA polymerase-3 subunit delta
MAFSSRAEGPWGGAAAKTVLAAVARGWPPGLTVLTGDDIYHLDQACDAIVGHLVPDRADSFALSVVGDESVSVAALVGLVRSTGMFAARRVVFVRDISGLEGDPDPLEAFAKDPPSGSFLIVRAPKLDRKRKIHKALAETGHCWVFRTPADASEFAGLAAEVGAMAKGRGVVLADRALRLLLDVCGSDLHRIAAEIEKISLWLGPDVSRSAPVEAAAVRALVAGTGLLSGWELADAITSRDRAGAIAAARRLVDSGDEPIRIVGGLASRVRALITAKAMTEAGAPAKTVVDAARAWYFRDALATGLKKYTLRELLAMPRQLLAVDRSFKSRSLDKGAVLEALVVTLTSPSVENR